MEIQLRAIGLIVVVGLGSLAIANARSLNSCQDSIHAFIDAQQRGSRNDAAARVAMEEACADMRVRGEVTHAFIKALPGNGR